MPATDLGRYIKRYLDLGHLFPSSIYIKFQVFLLKRLDFEGFGILIVKKAFLAGFGCF